VDRTTIAMTEWSMNCTFLKLQNHNEIIIVLLSAVNALTKIPAAVHTRTSVRLLQTHDDITAVTLSADWTSTIPAV